MRRVVVLALGVVLIASVLLFGVRALPAQDDRQAALVVAPTIPPTATPTGQAPESAGPAYSEADRTAALAFMAVFASGPSPAERPAWDAEMARLCDPDVADGLRYTDAGRLPVGRPTGAALVEEADDAAAVQVALDSGETWLVVLDGQGRVSDVRPT